MLVLYKFGRVMDSTIIGVCTPQPQVVISC